MVIKKNSGYERKFKEYDSNITIDVMNISVFEIGDTSRFRLLSSYLWRKETNPTVCKVGKNLRH